MEEYEGLVLDRGHDSDMAGDPGRAGGIHRPVVVPEVAGEIWPDRR